MVYMIDTFLFCDKHKSLNVYNVMPMRYKRYHVHIVINCFSENLFYIKEIINNNYKIFNFYQECCKNFLF